MEWWEKKVCPECAEDFVRPRGVPGRPRMYCGPLCKQRKADRDYRERKRQQLVNGLPHDWSG